LTWDLSCPDWEQRLQAGRSIIPDLPLDRAEADRAVAIWNKLRLPDVPGTPQLADAGGDWFRDIVAALFGAVDPATLQRYIVEVLCLVPKKNSKTTNGAALMLTALLRNRRPRAEFLLIGPSKLVSDLAFSQAVGMIEADDEGFLQKRMHVQDHLKQITDRRTKAKLVVKAFDTSVLTGAKPVGVLVDELHEIAADANADRVIGQLRGGLISNPEAFLVFITTQSERPPVGVFKTELEKARSIRDGRLKNVPMLPVLYEFPAAIAAPTRAGETPRWYDPSYWWMVTPNRGKSIGVDRLVTDFEAAKVAGDAEIRRWASQHLNIEVGMSIRGGHWPGAEYWERQADKSLTLEAVLTRSEVVVVGIDGGGLDDLFGLSVLGRCRETKHWLEWSHAWAHNGVLDRRKSIAQVLLDAKKAGELTIVDDELQDVSDIVEIVADIKERGLLGAVWVDPAGIGEFIDALAEIEVTQDGGLVFGAPQGIAMMNAIKTAERKLASRTLWHSGSSLMAWCVGNLRIEPTATAIRATKMNAGDAKIDPVMAMFDAVTGMVRNPQPVTGVSAYETEDLTVIG